MSEQDNIHHPIDKVIYNGRVYSLFKKREAVWVGDNAYRVEEILQMPKAELLATGIKLFKRENIQLEFYTPTGENESEKDGVVTNIEIGVEKYTVEELRSRLMGRAEAAALNIVNRAITAEAAFTRYGKNDWAASVQIYIDTDLKNAWSQTIEPAFQAAKTYQDLINYHAVWRDDIPAWPSGVPEPE